ncbi:hypothetical protein JVU11DRAFT_1475 [Chiua virens]|nr:hypothetical protein JVU11DRAFT_1475 [Chiua virens]
MSRPSIGHGSSLRLLMPTVRSPTSYIAPSPSFPPSLPPTRSPRAKSNTGRLSGVRSRSGSTTASVDRSGLAPLPAIWNAEQAQVTDGERWIGPKYRLEIVVERIELVGYQVYAVEKWIVERTRPVTVLTVYTGDPSHKIVVTALSPVSSITSVEAELEFKAAVQHLRKQNGARPRETPQGTLMVTSLAHFRSDYTIVHIPDGDFLAAQERLYSNINLLRMGCSGRSAVTLEEPSDTTKDRFKSTYFLSDGPPPAGAFRSKSHSRTHTRTYSQPMTTLSPAVPEASTLPSSSSHPMNAVGLIHPNVSQSAAVMQGPSRHPHFTSYVLELVKLLQAALAICGMFPLPPQYTPAAAFDGLLCDVTVDGLRRWVAEIGDNLISSESTERIADPNVVTALLSFVLSTRNKLATWGPAITKDPFLHAHEFLYVLSSWVHSQNVASNNSTQTLPVLTSSVQSGSANSTTTPGSGNTSAGTSPVIPQPFTAITSAMNSPSMSNPFMTHLSNNTLNPATTTAPTSITYLTLALHKSLLSQHDTKLRHSDSRKVHRAILSKLDLTSDSEATDDERNWLGGRVMGLVGRVGAGGSGSGPGSVVAPTADLGTFVREIVSGREPRSRDREREKEKDIDKERDKEKSCKDGESSKERMDDKERVGGSLKALWTGKLEVLARMRERAEGRVPVYRGVEREKESDKNWEKDKDRLTSSDLDDPVTKNLYDDELAFGGAWSGKVQKRLELWAGINRPRRLADHPSPSPVKPGGRRSSVPIPLSTQSSSSGHVYQAAELRGLGIPTLVLSHDNGDDDELLSSGQVSPASVSRVHNPFLIGTSPDVSSANLVSTENEQRVSDSLGSRRHSGIGNKGPKLSTWNEWERVVEGRGEAWWKARVPEDNAHKGSRAGLHRTRRHTFHDPSSVPHVRVLRTDWMRIDVELCGQLLAMQRREAHLEGTVKCLQYLTTTLAQTSSALRNAHTAHKPIMDGLTSHNPTDPSSPGTVLPTLAASSQAAIQTHTSPGLMSAAVALQRLPIPPPVPALQYEAAQLRVDDMWASTREVRKKVWELRSVVFGRENVLGVGGPGPGTARNEVGPRGRQMGRGKGRRRWTSQWRLDGTERLVDASGRTESEAEEERAILADGERSEGEEETESERESWVDKKSVLGDGMEEGESEAMGPMWLLRVFMSWGARLGIVKGETDPSAPSVPDTREPSPGEVVGDGRAVTTGGS